MRVARYWSSGLWASLLLTVLVCAGCIKVSGTNPANGALDIDRDMLIQVTFTNDPDPATVNIGSDFTAFFTTASAPPALKAVTNYPTIGAVSIELNPVIAVEFNADIDPVTVNLASFRVRDSADKPVAGQLVTSGPVITFTPVACLGYLLDYTVTVRSTIKGAGGQIMATDHVFTFTTRDHKLFLPIWSSTIRP